MREKVKVIVLIITVIISLILLQNRFHVSNDMTGDSFNPNELTDIPDDTDAFYKNVLSNDTLSKTVDENNADNMEENYFDVSDVSGQFTKEDLAVFPAKKTIQIGETFYINIINVDSEFDDYPDEEWDEICLENIDSIAFRSTKSSVASVNKSTGKVKGKEKGVAIIRTTINFANGESVTYKTKIYVTKSE